MALESFKGAYTLLARGTLKSSLLGLDSRLPMRAAADAC